MSTPTTGVPNTAKPGSWIVPPWPSHTNPYDVVNHFARFAPSDNASITEKLAYYKGYLAAMDTAPRDALKDHGDEHWYENLRDSIGRCVSMYQDKRAAEIQRTRHNLRSLQQAAQAAPPSRERTP